VKDWCRSVRAFEMMQSMLKRSGVDAQQILMLRLRDLPSRAKSLTSPIYTQRSYVSHGRIQPSSAISLNGFRSFPSV